MVQAKFGDTVRVHYTGRLEKGVVFDTSEGCEPLQFKIGEGRLVRGFEDAVIGMSPGERKVVKVPPELGYGTYRQDLEFELERSKLPEDLDLVVGKSLEICEDDGRTVPVEVMDIFDDKVVLNANHPLAGVELTFEITLLDIL